MTTLEKLQAADIVLRNAPDELVTGFKRTTRELWIADKTSPSLEGVAALQLIALADDVETFIARRSRSES